MKTDQIIEVYREEEIPELPEGMKYFVCIGGSRNFQCFPESRSLSRGDFMRKYQDQLAECLQPVFRTDTVQVRQDAMYAVPGFFIVSPIDEYAGLRSTPEDVLSECLLYSELVRKKMAAHPAVKNVQIYYNENFLKPTSTHFWVLPLFTDSRLSITQEGFWDYVCSFEYSKSKEEIFYWIDYLKKGGLT